MRSLPQGYERRVQRPVPGQDHDHCIGPTFPYLGHQIEAANARHMEVQQNQRDHVPGHRLDSSLAVGDCQHVISLADKNVL